MRSLKLLHLSSLRQQLIATYIIALLIATGAVLVLVLRTVGGNKQGLTSKGLAMQARWIAEDLQFGAHGFPVVLAGDRSWFYRSAPGEFKYRVLDSTGHVLLASDPDAIHLGTDERSVIAERSLSKTQIGGISFYTLTVLEPRSGGALYIQTARSERIDSLIRRTLVMPVLEVALWVELGSLALFTFAVYYTLSRMLIPVRAVAQAALRIEPENLSARLESRDLPSEMVPLIHAFNLALGRLERGYQVQSTFLAGAAHELKTPLALIRAQIELIPGLDSAVLLRDVDLMARQVHQLLHLAEASEAHNYSYGSLDVNSAVAEAVDHLRPLAEGRDVSIHVARPEQAIHCCADRSALFVLLKNLIENAIRHSPAGGVVNLSIRADGIDVRDHGGGIHDADFPYLFERFWRHKDQPEGGAGLGLAICLEIASVHGWRIEAHNATPGALFQLRFGRTGPVGQSGSP
jgi:two-component system, OmpR family, sensor histidine kinase QseC